MKKKHDKLFNWNKNKQKMRQQFDCYIFWNFLLRKREMLIKNRVY